MTVFLSLLLGAEFIASLPSLVVPHLDVEDFPGTIELSRYDEAAESLPRDIQPNAVVAIFTSDEDAINFTPASANWG